MTNLDLLLATECETAAIDFKAAFDPGSNQDWCEVIKDIVAIANSGGGVIIVGRNDDGSPNQCELAKVMALDPADVANKVERYTGCLYSDVRVVERTTLGQNVACLVLGGVHVPMVFTKPGTYPVSSSQQKTAFSQGAVYFRHGAKSEPGTSDDLREFVEREVARRRSEWLENVRKVVEAPSGATVVIVPRWMTGTPC